MIDLTGLSFAAVEPSLLEFGGIQRGALGGPSQNIQRMGNRFAFALALPPLPALTDWTARLIQAKQEGALIRIPEPGWSGASGGAPRVAASVAGGSSVALKGLTPGFTVPSKWISFYHAGNWYAHWVCAPVPADAGGLAAVTVTPMLRTPLTVNDLVAIDTARAQGLLTDKLSWPVGRDRLLKFTLSLEEQR